MFLTTCGQHICHVDAHRSLKSRNTVGYDLARWAPSSPRNLRTDCRRERSPGWALQTQLEEPPQRPGPGGLLGLQWGHECSSLLSEGGRALRGVSRRNAKGFEGAAALSPAHRLRLWELPRGLPGRCHLLGCPATDWKGPNEGGGESAIRTRDLRNQASCFCKALLQAGYWSVGSFLVSV